MKKLLAVLLGILMVCSLVSAQDMIKAGSKSLNFTFGGLGTFNLGGSGPATNNGLNNAGIGVSYFLNKSSAVRIGLQIVSINQTLSANAPAGQTGTDGSNSVFSLGVGADYLMYMTSASSRVRPYVGGGVFVALNSTSNKPAIIGTGTQTETKGGTVLGYTGGTAFGALAIIGAEVFIYPELSLTGEYNLNLINIVSPADIEVGTTSFKGNPITTILGFGSAGAGVRIYF